MKVLVADDDADLREVLVEFLELRGFEVLEATNGLETLLQVKRQVPEAVLLDLRMPRLGGIDALKRIRAFNPAINVVVITAEADAEPRRQALALGARAVLGKPVDLPAVLAAIGGDPPAPVRPAPSPAPAPAVAAEAPAAAPMPRVLVVDDDDDVREMLTEFLAQRRYRTAAAADAAAALRLIVETAPDFVLLDIDMPGLKGTEALPAIRAVAPRAIVVMVSGTADTELARRALALGAFDFVVKPIDWDYLTRSLETATSMKALEAG